MHLPMMVAGHDSIVMFIDLLSKYTYFLACTCDITAEQLPKIFLATIIVQHGMPWYIVSDCNFKFTSEFWKALLQTIGCMWNMSIIYYP